MKQRIANAEMLQTPDGPVKLKHWLIVVQEDAKRGIKAAPKLSMEHFATETYAAMSVGKSFSFFSEQAATAVEHYRRIKIKGLEDCEPTVKFIRRINVLIDAMNSNTPSQGLKASDNIEVIDINPPVCLLCTQTHAENTPQRRKPARQVLEDFLEFLKKWETSKVTRDRRLTASAAYGLRITVTTALELSLYLINDLNFEYLMIKRLKQNKLEHFFEEIRQGCGAHGHPDPAQFIQVLRLMSFKSLVKPARGSYVTGGDMLQSLLMLPDHKSIEEKEQDKALDTGEEIHCPFSDHAYYQSLTIDKSALKMFGGYVARKARKTSLAKECEECFQSLIALPEQPLEEDDDSIHSRSRGYLLTPSSKLTTILEKLALSVLEVFQSSHLHKDMIFEVAGQVKQKAHEEMGCWFHSRQLTKDIMSFYITARLIFACEVYNEYNRRLSANAKNNNKKKV
ncbi:Transposable element P transposase [Frankliniella fusca]|uniref:Transposable element P transposase n=1 Tax=Frankliniella fusca TaxID=407009 RepID=A0AAE1LCE4_9NEOP|nr:Transposable element P transposase [Frankliniella fusca]